MLHSVMLLLTHQCNLNCTYCYEHNKNNKKMSFEMAQKVISKTFDSISKGIELHIHFMGGEPLLEFSMIKQVTEWVQSQKWDSKYRFFIPTNATLLDSEMKKWFYDHRDIVKLGLSYDGNRISQNINRDNSYEQIDFDFFLKTYPDRAIKMTISPMSISQLYESIIELNERGFMHIDAELAHGINWSRDNLIVYSKELNKLIEYYVANPTIPRVSLFNLNIPFILRTDIESKKCGCGTNFKTYDTDGEEYYCQLFSPLALSKLQIEKSKKLDMSNDSLFTNDICSKCVLKNICIGCCGMNFKYTGKLGTVLPVFCHIFKLQFFAACKLQKITINQYDDDYKKLLRLAIDKVNKYSSIKIE